MRSVCPTTLQSIDRSAWSNTNIFHYHHQINASKRMKEAARERAEGDKVVQVKIAEAAAEVRLLLVLGLCCVSVLQCVGSACDGTTNHPHMVYQPTSPRPAT